MKLHLLLLLLLPACLATAGERTSANYSILTEAMDYGGVNASSANYQQSGSAAVLSGTSKNGSGSVVAESGYVAQINLAPLAVVSVVSRKGHGAAGTFDINLPLTGPAGVECRTGGAGGNHQVVVTLTSPVSVGGLSVESINGQAGGTQSVIGSAVTINLTAVANAQTIGITLLNVSDGSSTANFVIPMSVLVGDTSGNGSVTATDIGQTKARSGQPLHAGNFRSDLNASGSINASDIGQVKAVSGTTLP